MGVLVECQCRRKQSTKNKKCNNCGLNLDKAKRNKRVKYWISYRLPNGKQRRESVGAFEGLSAYSIKDAEDALSKRKTQKKEKRIFEMLPESQMTFSELGEWYIKTKSVKRLATFDRILNTLSHFNSAFGNKTVDSLKLNDLSDYQESRLDAGAAKSTVDRETRVIKTMVTRAIDNDLIGGDTIKPFRKIKNKLKRKGARTRKITVSEYKALIGVAPLHLKAVLTFGFNTGMRLGDIIGLKWSQIDRKAGFIRLTEADTKEDFPRIVPMNHHVNAVLNELPRAINHDYVITYKGRPISGPGGIKRSFQTACRNAGIPYGRKILNGITFHVTRRSVKTFMAKAGVYRAHRDAILGHASSGMDAYYLHLDEEDLIKAMDQYTAWLDETLTLKDSNSDSVDSTVDSNEN
jgi:integrase